MQLPRTDESLLRLCFPRKPSATFLEIGKWLRGAAPDLRAPAEPPRSERARVGELSVLGSLQLSVRFLPVPFERRTRRAGPAGQDGVRSGLEARPTAGQRPRWPPRLSTNALQVGRRP